MQPRALVTMPPGAVRPLAKSAFCSAQDRFVDTMRGTIPVEFLEKAKSLATAVFVSGVISSSAIVSSSVLEGVSDFYAMCASPPCIDFQNVLGGV